MQFKNIGEITSLVEYLQQFNDYESAKKALVYMVQDLNEEKIESFKEGNR